MGKRNMVKRPEKGHKRWGKRVVHADTRQLVESIYIPSLWTKNKKEDG